MIGLTIRFDVILCVRNRRAMPSYKEATALARLGQ
jgi:hypothetical protein